MCGVFGVFGHSNGKQIAKTGIWAEQHRGQDAAGIACLRIRDSKKGLIEVEKNSGKVREVFGGPDFDDLKGDAWIAHVRYSTQGKPSKRNAQPHYAQSIYGRIAIVSNGDVINMEEQKSFLDHKGIQIYTENDAELIAASINYQVTLRRRDIVEAITQVMEHIRGAFSALVITEFDDRLFAFRDPYGIRPLFCAIVESQEAKTYLFASETSAFDAVMPLFGPGAKIESRMVRPGEILAVGPGGMESFQGVKADRLAFCLFEFVYFSRPDSTIGVKSFQAYRINAGKELYKEHPVDADLVSPIPKSGIPAGVGYAFSGIPYVPAIIENPSFNIDFGRLRTFIESTEQERLLRSQLKFNYIADLIQGKTVVTVDDSIVRGLITGVINKELWQCRAKRVHIRIASPPYRFPCFYGIETKKRKTLVAANRTVEEIKQFVGNPTTLAYLSLDGLVKSVEMSKNQICTACFDGDYPIEIPKNFLE